MTETIETTHAAPDGTALAVVLFRPESATAADPAPALLQRTPYGTPDEPPAEGVAGRALAAGYVVAFADTRGRGESDGAFLPWVHEATDGAATVEWLADRPFVRSDGAVGMFGGSSPGQVQLFAASEDPDGLGAIAPTFTPSDLHRADFFQDGACSAMTLLTWSLGDSVAGHTVDRLERRGQLDAETAAAARAALDDALGRIGELASHRPFREVPAHVLRDVSLPAGVDVTDVVPHWDAWLDRPAYDDFWESFDPEVTYDRITVPGLHTTGWYELCQEGTVSNYRGLRRASDAPQHLVIGPWAHQNQGRVVGDVDFGPAASADAYGRGDQLLAFFDTYLRGEPREPFADPDESLVETLRVCATGGESRVGGDDGSSVASDGEASVGSDGGPSAGSDDGSNAGSDGEANVETDAPEAAHRGTGEWVAHDDWPPNDARRQVWYLSSDGDATGADAGDGRLTRDRPGKFEPADEWTHDPTEPVPTRGGPLCCRDETREAGAFDRRDLQERPDVATYTTPPLAEPLEVAGPVGAELTVATSAPDTDVVCVLTHLTADGRAFELCEGIRRVRFRHGRDRPTPVEPGQPVRVPVDMWSTHYRVPAGDRLRLEVAGSNWPRFDPHPGTREPWRTGPDEVRTADQTLFHETDRESRLSLFVR
ncbi:MAG: CocE/NonD family hydrolase [Halobaculum sp.]